MTLKVQEIMSCRKRAKSVNITLYFSEVKHFLTVDLKDALIDLVTDDDVEKLMGESDADNWTL